MIHKFSDFSLKKWAYQYAKDNHDGFNSYEDATEELDIIFSEIEEMPNKLSLFRIVEVESEDDIDFNNLGNHFLQSEFKQRIYDSGFYHSIGLSPNSDSRFFIVEVIVDKSDIDWKQTIDNRLNFPREFELTISKVIKFHITSVTELDKSKIV